MASRFAMPLVLLIVINFVLVKCLKAAANRRLELMHVNGEAQVWLYICKQVAEIRRVVVLNLDLELVLLLFGVGVGVGVGGHGGRGGDRDYYEEREDK